MLFEENEDRYPKTDKTSLFYDKFRPYNSCFIVKLYHAIPLKDSFDFIFKEDLKTKKLQMDVHVYFDGIA